MKCKVLHMHLNLGDQANWGGSFHPKLTFGSQVQAACAQSKPTSWSTWCHVMQNKLVKLMFFPHSESNWSPYVLILCCAYKQGFHENQLQGEQKGKASQEACIVKVFPRCFICTLSGWKLFLFRLSAWFFFGCLWFLYHPEHLGPRLLFIAVWKQSFLFPQFGPGLNLWTASNIHCLWQSWGWRIQDFQKQVLPYHWWSSEPFSKTDSKSSRLN